MVTGVDCVCIAVVLAAVARTLSTARASSSHAVFTTPPFPPVSPSVLSPAASVQTIDLPAGGVSTVTTVTLANVAVDVVAGVAATEEMAHDGPVMF